MPIEFRKWITRQDLRSEPDTLFIFGDNEARVGMGGQAAECRGESNAIGVATKRSPGMAPSDFWSDDDFDRIIAVIDADLVRAVSHLRAGGKVIYPSDGIGTGLSQLPTKAPRVYSHLSARIYELEKMA